MSSNETFVLIKPDGVERKLVCKIISYFTEHNIFPRTFDLQIATVEKITSHYAEHIERFGSDFEVKTKAAFEGKMVIPVVLSGADTVISDVRKIVGATESLKAAKGTIRGDLGLDDSIEKANSEFRLVENLIHASDSEEAVKREAGIWLPNLDSIH